MDHGPTLADGFYRVNRCDGHESTDLFPGWPDFGATEMGRPVPDAGRVPRRDPPEQVVAETPDDGERQTTSEQSPVVASPEAPNGGT
jgi:hypothetical protein